MSASLRPRARVFTFIGRELPIIGHMSRLAAPSPYQEAIFRFIEKGSGHGVVKATAGSGKTTTLVEVAHRLPKDAWACFLAFNSHVARELKTRLPARVDARTVHSLGRAMLATHLGKTRKLELEPKKYTALTQAHLRRDERTWRLPRQEMHVARTYLKELCLFIRLELSTPDDLPELVRRYRLRPPDDPALTAVLHELVWAVLDAGFERSKEGVIDYPDMLFVPVIEGLFPARRFDFVFVDEAQDLSKVQLALVMRCVRPRGRLLFVGDERQSVYGFSGADTNSVGRIVDLTKATVLPLSVSYRCPRAHVQLARQFSPEIQAAPGALEGTVRVVSETELSRRVRPGDLVLCRMNAPLVGAALGLIQKNIPARVEGRDIAGRLCADVKSAFPEHLGNWRAKLDSFERKELESLFQSRLPEDVRERLLTQREDELACLRVVVEDAVRQEIGTPEGLTGHIAMLFRDRGRCVTLSTVHKAKGKEAARVFILHPHLMPLPYAETKEDRLGETCVQFVAVTRSLAELTFLEAESAPIAGGWWRQTAAASPSREAPPVALPTG